MENQKQFRMIEDDLDPEIITQKTIEIINNWFEKENIIQNEVQQKMLFSHVKAMVERAKSLEKLPEVEENLFNEISEESMILAKKTVELFNSLEFEESYLLAVHFEVARANEK